MERGQYEQSLKHYRDLQNSLSFAKEEAKKEGKEEGHLKVIEVGLKKGFSLSLISELIELPISRIKEIIADQGWDLN